MEIFNWKGKHKAPKGKLDLKLVLGSADDTDKTDEEVEVEVNDDVDSYSTQEVNGFKVQGSKKKVRERDGSPRRSLHVKFADENETVDITPRSGASSAKGGRSRIYSGKPGLRHVKSKTDSGIKLTPQKGEDNVPKNRPSSGKKGAKISTITVDYLEEEDDDATEKKKKTKKKGIQSAGEIETLMSQMLFDDEKNEHESETDVNPNSRSISSVVNRNYYEMALKAARTKTVKTLKFSDGGLLEDKTVTVINQNALQSKAVFVAPKPQVRPSTATTPINKRPSSPLANLINTFKVGSSVPYYYARIFSFYVIR